MCRLMQFQHTAARRRLTFIDFTCNWLENVSTHSRSKAADLLTTMPTKYLNLFQHTAARRRLSSYCNKKSGRVTVSTHSRSKAADCASWSMPSTRFQHTAARRRLIGFFFALSQQNKVSTHSRSKAADFHAVAIQVLAVCFNTQPLEGG